MERPRQATEIMDLEHTNERIDDLIDNVNQLGGVHNKLKQYVNSDEFIDMIAKKLNDKLNRR